MATSLLFPAEGPAPSPAAATPAQAGAANPSPAAPATPGASQEPLPLPADSPERRTQDSLSAWLKEFDAHRLDALAAQKFSRAEIAQRLQTLEQSGKADELVNAYLLYLADYPPEPKNYLEILSRLAWLLHQRGDSPSLLTFLFQQADHFPPSANPVLQLRLIEAEFLLRVGLSQPALVALHQVSDLPNADPLAHSIATGRAGFLHERLGQIDEAVASYLKSEGDLTTAPQANEAFMRAALLQLELGKTDDALATLLKLRTIPPSVLRQSPAAPAVTEMLELVADPAAARAYWAHQNDWYLKWRALAPSLGVKLNDPKQVSSPYIDDYRRLAVEGSNALNQKTRDSYFQIAHQLMRSARWKPNDLADAATLLYQGIKLAPEQSDQILALAFALESGLPPAQKNLIKQMAQLRVAALLDSGHREEARVAALQAIEANGTEGPGGEALARLYAFTVLQTNAYPREGTKAADFLQKSFADPNAHGAQRTLAAAVLCDLLLALEREGDVRAFLEKEVAAPVNPAVGGERYQATLRDSLNRLQERTAKLAAFNTAVAAWWTRFQFPWYQYTVSAPQAQVLGQTDSPAAQSARQFERGLDPSTPPATRGAAILSAFGPYPALLPTGSAIVDGTMAFTQSADIPEEIRYAALSNSLWHLLWTNQRAAAAKLLPVLAVNAEERPAFQLWLDFLALPADPASQIAFADKLFAQPKLNRYQLVLVIHILQSLARAGAADAAQNILNKITAASMDENATQQLHQTGANLAALIAQCRDAQPAYDAMRKLILDGTPAAATAVIPEGWQNLNDPFQANLDLLTDKEICEGLAAIIRDRLSYGRHPLQVFLDYAQALPNDGPNNALRFQLFETAQRLTQTDDDHFYAALFANLVDFDDPALAKRGWAVLTPLRLPDKLPKTESFLKYYDAMMQWRTGKKIDPMAALGPFDGASFDPYKLRLALEYGVQQQDRALLDNLLQARPEKDYLQATVIAPYIQALRFLGRSAAATRAAEGARALLARAIVDSWAEPGLERAQPVFGLARLLKEPTAYPRAWLDYQLQIVRNADSLDLIRLADAQLQKNWPAALEAASSFLSRNPTHYDIYWPQAQALIELNRPSDAVEPLRTFLKYSHNEADYAEAEAALKKIEAASASGARGIAAPGR